MKVMTFAAAVVGLVDGFVADNGALFALGIGCFILWIVLLLVRDVNHNHEVLEQYEDRLRVGYRNRERP